MKIKIELITDLLKRERTQKEKIFLSASIGWIFFIGFLTWVNGLNDIALIKTFKWDEWFWFGIVPAIAPYIFFFIWKKKDIDKDQDSSKT
mgnify:FL=1